MNKKVILGSTLGIATILGASAFALGANAYRGDYSQKGPDCNVERHEQMEEVFEKNDYNAWKELMNGRGRVLQVVNEENFPKFAEARKLAQEGKYEEADAIRAELGLRTRNGEPTGRGFGKGEGQGRGQGPGQGRLAR